MPTPFRSLIPALPSLLLGLAAVSTAGLAGAQSAGQAQSLYEQRIASCDPNLPRPQYNGCVRAAGIALDSSGAAASSGTFVGESTDGRATILQPSGASGITPAPSAVTTETRTSNDGRATILVPSDSTMRGGFTQ